MSAATRRRIPERVAADLKRLLGDRARFDEPLAAYSSMGVGGPADVLCRVGTAEELNGLLDVLAAAGVPRLLIGGGSNLIPADQGFRGAAIRLEGDFRKVMVGPGWLEAGAAAPLAALVERAMVTDQGGLEFTTGIPGGVGGSLAGNAGTATESLGDRVERVDTAFPGGRMRTLSAADLKFAYRTSAIRALGGVVTAARFRLEPRPRSEVASRVRAFTDKRKDQPLTFPNVGCIFKNPPGESAGRLIDRTGLKGAREGGVEVSAKHANFMINRGGATAADVRALIGRVREGVLAAAGVVLEPEVIVLDEFGNSASLAPEPVC